MSAHILKCPKCGTYTLCDKCSQCGSKTVSQIPAKYSPQDPYGKYRREAKRELLSKQNLL